MERKGFYCYSSFLDFIEPLTDAERGRLFTSCLQYSKTGEVPELSGNERFVFPPIRSQIDRDWAQSEIKSDKLRENARKKYDKQDDAIASNCLQMHPIASNCIQKEAKGCNWRYDKDKDKDKDKDIPPLTPPPGATDGKKPNGFDRFWEKYPRKTGKAAALKVWSRLRPTEALTAQMLDALSWQVECEQWTKENGQYIPNPATWLNQGRWEDEKPESTGKSDSSFDTDEFFKAALNRRYHPGGKA